MGMKITRRGRMHHGGVRVELKTPDAARTSHLYAHRLRPSATRGRRPGRVHDAPAWHQGSTVGAWRPERQMGAAPPTAFSAPVAQARSEDVGWDSPRRAGGGSGNLI